MVVDALHAQVSELAASGRIDIREFCSSVRAGLLSLLAADAGSRLWRRLVLGLILLGEKVSTVYGKVAGGKGTLGSFLSLLSPP